MKKLVLFTLSVCFVGLSAFNPQTKMPEYNKDYNGYRKITHKAFQPGEKLKYRLHYGIIDAGEAVLEVKEHPTTIAGRKIYHMVGNGYSKGTFDWFFKVRDRYETYMDADGVFPWLFVRRVDEGGYKINQDYKFYQNKNKVDNGEGKTFDTPEGVQDMLSAFYYARTIDFSKAKKGDVFTVTTFVDDEIFPLQIKYAGTAVLKMDGVKYNTLKFHPVVQKGRIFKNEEDLTVYISNDGNKIPLMAQAKILVGSIKMELVDSEGLANPLNIVE